MKKTGARCILYSAKYSTNYGFVRALYSSNAHITMENVVYQLYTVIKNLSQLGSMWNSKNVLLR